MLMMLGLFDNGQQFAEIVDNEIRFVSLQLFAGIVAGGHTYNRAAGGIPSFLDIYFGVAYLEDLVGGSDVQVLHQSFYHIRVRPAKRDLVAADRLVDQGRAIVPAETMQDRIGDAAGKSGIER